MSRAYKNKKFNKDNYTKYGISPKYFSVQASRFPGSIKKQYCDEDRDGFADATYTKRRSEAVRKGTGCVQRVTYKPNYGTERTESVVLRMYPEMGDDEYFRTGLLDLEINEGVFQIAGTTEFARAASDADLTERRLAGVQPVNFNSLSGDGSTYAEVTAVYDSGTTQSVVNIYNKAGGSWQLQSSVYTNANAYGIWLNEDGTSFITSGRFDQWSDGSDKTSFRRYEFIGGEWVIVGPETGKSFEGQRELVELAVHVTYDLKYITPVYWYKHLGQNSVPSDERYIGVLVHEWNEENKIYETRNTSYETLYPEWPYNVLFFFEATSSTLYESFYDAVNDQLRIIFRQPSNLDIRVLTYTAETKTFETANNGEKEATIWGNDTPLAERTAENSATHTQIIANSNFVDVALTRDGNYLALASKSEGYQLFEWNPETMEYDVYASLAYDNRAKVSNIRSNSFVIVDRNNFLVMGSARTTGPLHHYRVNESNMLEYAGDISIGKYWDVQDNRMAVS